MTSFCDLAEIGGGIEEMKVGFSTSLQFVMGHFGHKQFLFSFSFIFLTL